MSQDLFFIPLNDDVAQDFDRKLVAGILDKGATKPGFACSYPDGSGGEAHVGDEGTERVEHIGFTHFGGRTMMERIFELADALEVFLAWSDAYKGEPSACVTREERLAQVRDDARHFNIVVARDPSHLNLLVKGVTFEENGW